MNENDIQKNLQKAKPKADRDPAFEAGLRTRLLFDLRKKTSAQKTNPFIFMIKNMRYALAGLAVLVIVGIGVLATTHQKPGSSSSDILASNITVTKVQNDAFGSLGSLTINQPSNSAAAPAPAMAPAQTNGAAAANAPAMIATGGGSSGASGSAIAMPIRPPSYYPSIKYVYKGAPLNQDQAQLDVLKYIATPYSATQLSTALAQANFSGIDLSTFQGLDVTNVTLSEDQDFGYQFYIDLVNGTISINENYLKWPQDNSGPQPLIPTNAGADNAANTGAAALSDSDVIAIANTFMSDHNISRANYGDPEVTHEMYATPMMKSGTSAAPMIPYYSNSEQVLYPILVSGKTVYSSSGSKIGLTVEVNIEYKRVMNVYGLSTQNYQSSAYDAITDTSTILSLAENPQIYPMIYNGVGVMAPGASGGTVTGSVSSGTNTANPAQIEIDLGTPTMGYVQLYQSDSSGQNNEYLVPAYIFPVISNTAGTGDNSDQNVVVPLIKDFTQQTTTVYPPRPLPPTIKAPAPTK